ncbi:hypothetical protein D3874_15330 [Oleomonas cavernae]|uniref:Uncharacterized protein n=1 Tax=Oleomonas cavernae TaxID=2320859 RepID=A0A418WDW9_9PROT|nr:hypothetical protein D3874_15330 [Oleomonas cavernae]
MPNGLRARPSRYSSTSIQTNGAINVTICASCKTVQGWESGSRQPAGAARTLLRVVEKEPEAVRRALAAA